MLLDGKVAYVSGAAGAIGGAIARRLCEQGARVVAGDVDAGTAEALCAELRGRGHDARAVRHDVTSRAETEAALAAVLSAHGASTSPARTPASAATCPCSNSTTPTWEHVLAVNTTGVLLTLQAFGSHMVEQRSGALVVTASISSLRGAHSMGAYCASKFAVMGLVESLAKEVGELRRARRTASTRARSRAGWPAR